MVKSHKRINRTGNRIVDDGLEYIAMFYTDLALSQMFQWEVRAQRSVDQGLGLDVEEALPLIMAVNKWKDAVNDKIASWKFTVQAGGSYNNDFENIGDPPVSYTDVYLAAHPNKRPDGWEMPDVTGYVPDGSWDGQTED